MTINCNGAKSKDVIKTKVNFLKLLLRILKKNIVNDEIIKSVIEQNQLHKIDMSDWYESYLKM